MPPSTPPASPTSSNSGEAKNAEDYERAARAERDEWRRHAKKYASVYSQELEALRRQEPPDDPEEAALWYEMAESKRERALGIPDNADPVQVMIYLEELMQESRAGNAADADGEHPHDDTRSAESHSTGEQKP